jgi:hypothetical protein
MIKGIGVAAALALAFAGSASAQCPGAVNTPFGTDDGGFLTCNKVASKCEQKIAGNVSSKLVAGILKCHTKAADSAFKAAAFDEDGCDTAAQAKFTAKTVNTDCTCVDIGGLSNLARSVIDGANSQVYCDPAGTPFGGDDAGNVPSTQPILKCEDGIGKCVPKLVKGYIKCHQSAAKAFLSNKAFDEEACEQGPIPGKPGKAAVEAFNTCVGKVQAKGGCQGCEDIAGILSLTDAQLDGANGLIYCSSPSAAFVE